MVMGPLKPILPIKVFRLKSCQVGGKYVSSHLLIKKGSLDNHKPISILPDSSEIIESVAHKLVHNYIKLEA